MENFELLVTERADERSCDLSAMSIEEQVRLMNEENYRALDCLESQYDKIVRVIEKCVEALKRGGRLIYMGAGTSGMIGWLDALECPPTFGLEPKRVLGLLAGGPDGFLHAGVEDHEENGRRDLEKIDLCQDDLVIGLAASGRTPYVMGGLRYASKVGASIAAIVCNEKSPISQLCPLTIEALSGPEVLTGSTRLKAGTATKLVCNMISTLSMVELGKVYKNYMVDVQMSNEKLVDRGGRIVCDTTGCSRQEALKTLEGRLSCEVCDRHADERVFERRSLCDIRQGRWQDRPVVEIGKSNKINRAVAFTALFVFPSLL